jgi:hypothetical protein
MPPTKKKHTIESVTLVAAKFPTRAEFQKQALAEYDWAWKHGLLDTVSPHTKAKDAETAESVMSAAKLCKTNKEFCEKFPRQYSWMYRLGIKDECSKFWVSQWEFIPSKYSNEGLLETARQCETIGELRENYCSEYGEILRRGLMAEVRKFLSRKRSLPNVVYIWEAIGATFNGEKVYKIGISRTSFGSARVEMVSKKSGFGCNLIAFVEIGEHAKQIENAILKMGYNPKFYGFDGCTEFRALSDDQLEKALTIIREAAHDALSLNQAA